MHELIGVRQAAAEVLEAMGPLTARQVRDLMPSHINKLRSVAAALSELTRIGACKAVRIKGAGPTTYELVNKTLVPEQQVGFRPLTVTSRNQPPRKTASLAEIVDPPRGDEALPARQPEPAIATGVEYYAIAKFPDGSRIKLTLEQAILLRDR